MMTYRELAESLGIDLDDPLEQLIGHLLDQSTELIDALSEARHQSCTQQDVADRTGWDVEKVSKFESRMTDPCLSEVWHYAAAVGVEITCTTRIVEGLKWQG